MGGRKGPAVERGETGGRKGPAVQRGEGPVHACFACTGKVQQQCSVATTGCGCKKDTLTINQTKP
eukprot:4543530-Karenia_brevis.AAC.1